jgi:Protein of unknown function (DUF1488)
MNPTNSTEAPPKADGIRFEIRSGMRKVSCSVSDDALEAASGLAAPSTSTLRRRSFDRFRTLINQAATLKLATLPDGCNDLMLLTRDDLRRVPTMTGEPEYGMAVRSRPAPDYHFGRAKQN